MMKTLSVKDNHGCSFNGISANYYTETLRDDNGFITGKVKKAEYGFEGVTKNSLKEMKDYLSTL